jgi:hypothetical protein
MSESSQGGRQMTYPQRAQQFWSVLVFAAREQKIVSYNMLSKMTGMAKVSGPVLYYIYCYCKQEGLPFLNYLVVNQPTGRPGDECPGNLSDLHAEQSRVFVYDWLSLDEVPTDRDFVKAKQEESLKAHDKKAKAASATKP